MKNLFSIPRLLAALAVLCGTSAFAQSPYLALVGPNFGAANTTQTIRLIGYDLRGSTSTQLCYVPPMSESPACTTITPPNGYDYTANFTVPAAPVTGTGFLYVRIVSGEYVTTSGSYPFYIGVAGPTASSVTPTSIPGGSGDTTVTVGGSSLAGGSLNLIEPYDYWYPDETSLGITSSSATQITAPLPSNTSYIPTTTRYIYAEKFINDNPVNSALILFNVTPPAITSTNPASLNISANPVNVTINGRFGIAGTGATPTNIYFLKPGSESTVLVGTVSGTSGTVTIPANQLDTTGTAYFVPRYGEGEGGVEGDGFAIQVNPPVPVISSATPSPIMRATAATITLTGTNLTTITSLTYTPPGGTAAPITPQSASATSVVVNLTALNTANVGTGTFNLTTASGTTSGGVLIVQPALTSATPNTVLKNTATTITLAGTNFITTGNVTSATAQFTAPVTSTVSNIALGTLSATSGQFALPAIPNSGVGTVRVVSGGAQSGTVNITVIEPVISSTSPASALQGGASFTLTLNGTNFTAGGTPTVRFTPQGGSATVLTVTGTPTNTQITATVPNTLIASAGTAVITVQTGAAVSPNYSFSVGNGPTLTSINPASAVAGSAQIANFVLTGTNFTAGGSPTVNWTGPSGSGTLTVSNSTATSITATIPANFLTTAGAATVSVTTGGSTTGTQTFTINQVPVIYYLSPYETFAGGPSFTLYIGGANLNVSGSPTVRFTPPGGTQVTLTPSSVSASELAVSIPNNLIATAGNATIQVVSGAATSTVENFLILPSPVITSIAPTGVPQGSPNTTLTINGANFTAGFYYYPLVRFGGTTLETTTITATQILATIPASLLTTPGPVAVTVELVYSGGGGDASASASARARPQVARDRPMVGPVSNAVNFVVFGPVTVTSLNPARAPVGSPAFPLSVSGAGFRTGDVLDFNGTSITPSSITETLLTATVPANLITTTGAKPVRVRNSINTNSNSLNFIADYVITQISPNGAVQGGPAFPITVTATTPIAQGASVVFNGTTLAASGISGNTITANVPANLISNATGSLAVTITDGVSVSNPISFVMSTQLSISSISPTRTQAGSPAFTLSLTGNGFVSGMALFFNGTSITPTVQSTTAATATIPANLVATAGVYPVYVRIGGEVPRESNRMDFTVFAPLNITTLTPNRIEAGSAAFTVAIAGGGFVEGMTAVFNGTPVTTTVQSATAATASIPANLVTTPGTYQVFVRVNDGIARESNRVDFTVLTRLQLTSMSPTRANAAGAPFTLTVNGAGFVQGAVIRFNGVNLTTNFINATTLQGTVNTGLLGAPATVEVRVTLPDARVSSPLSFTILPQLRITSITPGAVAAGANTFTLTVNGEGFVQESVVRFGGFGLITTFVSATQLTAVVSDTAVANPTQSEITVANPGGTISNAVDFAVGGNLTVSSVSPATAPLNSPAVQITVSGSGFTSSAVARFGSADLQTTFISATQLRAIVPETLLRTAGNIPVSVSIGGQTSNSVNFEVGAKPELTFLNPNAITAGGRSFTMIVLGRNFLPGAVIHFGTSDLTTTFVSASQLSGVVPAEFLATARTVPVTVSNPQGDASNSLDFRILALSLTSVDPSRATAGGAAFTLNLSGTGFITGATVSFGSTPLSTSFGSATSLTAQVPASAIATPGNIDVTVSNPDGARSNAVRFLIESGVPTITRVNPSTVVAGTGEVSITLTGGGYVNGSSVQINGSGVTTSFGDTTSLTAVIPANLTNAVGTLAIKVVNPGNVESNTVNFAVTAPTPAITRVNPATVNAGSSVDVTIALTGTGFVNGSSVQFNGNGLETSFGSSTSLSAVIPVSLLASAGNASIRVVNPGDVQSNTVQFVIAGDFSVTAVNPATLVTGGTGNVSIGVAGTGFVNGSVVQLGSNALATTFNSATSLTAIVPRALITAPGTLAVSVQNPNGAISNSLNIRVENPIPVPPLTLNVPAVITPAGNGRVQVTLEGPAPVDLQGTLVITFVNNSNNAPTGYVDPALLFAGSGSRTINFTIPAGSSSAIIPTDGAFSPGTVAGTIVVTITSLSGGGQVLLPDPAPTRNIVVDRAVPVVVTGTVRITNIAGGFQVELNGISSPRDLTRISYTFSAGTSILEGTTIPVDVAALFNSYFASQTGQNNGGAFRFVMPFTVSGGEAASVTSVSVTLTNSVGNSTVVTGGR